MTRDNSVAGLFKVRDTHGYPLECILEQLQSNNLVVDWEDYAQCAKTAGWSQSKVFNEIYYACREVYRGCFKEKNVTRLSKLLEKIWNG